MLCECYMGIYAIHPMGSNEFGRFEPQQMEETKHESDLDP